MILVTARSGTSWRFANYSLHGIDSKTNFWPPAAISPGNAVVRMMENWPPLAIIYGSDAPAQDPPPERDPPTDGTSLWTADDAAGRSLADRWRGIAELVAAGTGMTGAIIARCDGEHRRVVAVSAALSADRVRDLVCLGRLAPAATVRAVTDTRGSDQPVDAAMARAGFASYATITIAAPDDRPLGMIAAVDRARNGDVRRVTGVLRTAAALLEDDAAMLDALARTRATVKRLRLAISDAEMGRLLADRENAAKSSFLAAMSHELRTPLNAIIGFSEILKDQLFGPIDRADYVQYANDIHESGCHLISLINDVLDVAKIEANRVEIDPEWLDMAETLNTGVKLVSVQARKRGLSIEAEACQPGLCIYADERTLKQILFNLLSNAVKYTDEGGRVTVGGHAADDGGAVIVVADSGVGIPPDALKRLVRPFERVDNRFDTTHQGFGLGLALVSKLTKLHGGTLDIDSTVGVGTRVTVTFPPPAAGSEDEPD